MTVAPRRWLGTTYPRCAPYRVEAVAALNTIAYQIEPLVLPNGFPALVHMSLSDKSGDSAVIEYIGGQAKVYHDKRFTVMTNEPTYDKQIENLKQYRTFGGDKPLPGERIPSDRFVRAAYYANGLPKPTSRAEGAAYMFSVIRNVSAPFGMGDPDKPDVASTIFRTVIDLTGGRYYFESTYAPNVVWIDYTKLDFRKGAPQKELQVEKNIFSLNGDVTRQLEKAKPFVFGMNKRGCSSQAFRGSVWRRLTRAEPVAAPDRGRKAGPGSELVNWAAHNFGILRSVTNAVTMAYMIKSFAHKGLEKFFTMADQSGIQAIHAKRLRLILALLNDANQLGDLEAPALGAPSLKR